MRDDLNTPVAMAVVHDILKGDYIIEEVRKFFADLENIFGVRFLPIKQEVPSDVQEMAEKRWQARQNSDFAESDRLRDEILSRGYEVRDEDDTFVILPLEK